jgi:hypothetical protein
MTQATFPVRFPVAGMLLSSYPEPMNDDRFTDHARVTPEEAGTVTDANGKKLLAGDPGFMEALAAEAGFEFEDLTGDDD